MLLTATGLPALGMLAGTSSCPARGQALDSGARGWLWSAAAGGLPLTCSNADPHADFAEGAAAAIIARRISVRCALQMWAGGSWSRQGQHVPSARAGWLDEGSVLAAVAARSRCVCAAY